MELRAFTLERYFAPREHTARAHLSCSDCEALPLADVLARADPEARRLYDTLSLGYSEARGLRALRAEISSQHGVSEDDVLCTAPSEGILLAMLAMLAPGDTVVVPAPAYQSLSEIARAKGCTVREWHPVAEPTGWRFDPAALEPLARGAKMVVVNFPHNPTGAHPTAGEWAQITEITTTAGAWLFSDEMYRSLEPRGVERLPSAVELSDRAIALGGLSKAFSAPGLRAGWLACRDRDALARMAELKDYTTICGNGVGEVLALMVLRDREEILRKNLARIAKNADAVDDLCAQNPGRLSWTRPRSGCVGLARLDDGTSADALCDELFREQGVLLLPSTVFAFGDAHVRFGLGRDGFVGALTSLQGVL